MSKYLHNERTFIMFVLNIWDMKTSLVLKLFFILPILLFANYLLMALIGCVTCLFELGDDFYCGPYCLIGKIALGLSVLFFGYLLFPEIASIIKNLKNVTSSKESKNM